jgi:replicative DNA helicase
VTSKPNNPQIPDAPASIESEKALIGAVLIDPDQYYVVAAFLSPNDFFFIRHQRIWEAMARLIADRVPVDIVTLSEELENRKHLEAIGGRAYIAELTNSIPTSRHAEFYGQMISRAAIRRRILKAADEIKALAADEALDVESVQSKAFATMLGTMNVQKNAPRLLGDLLDDFGTRVEDAVYTPRTMLGCPGALPDVANLLRGYQRGKFVISAGRPGMGKSAYLLSDALALARHFPVLFFTLEMPSDEVIGRILQNTTGLQVEPLLIGRDGAEGYKRYLDSIRGINGLPLLIDDTPNLSPAMMEARIQMVRGETNFELGAVFCDYLQLINARAEIPKNGNREQEISHISRTMKTWAKQMNLTVHAASQLSRALEQRADKRPMLSDLRESGSLEQDADIVQLLYRDSYYHRDRGWITPQTIAQVEVNVAKHRGGPTGLTHAAFDLPRQRFVGVQRTPTADIPPRERAPRAEGDGE